MGVEVAIVADDLTGALDAAAPFVRAGRSAVVAIDAQWLDRFDGEADVVAVSTSTRNCGAEDAVRRVTDACDALGPSAPTILFKKIDSTLRGHVVAETLAVLAATGRQGAIVCPAVPAQGRVVRERRVFVNGRPLVEWLPPGEAERWRCDAALDEMLAAGGDRVTCCDARDDGDLAAIAGRVRRDGTATLAVGASGLAAALAGEGSALPIRLEGPFLFVLGSRTRETARQLSLLEAVAGTALLAAGLAETVPADLPALGTRRCVLVPDEAAIPAATDPSAVAAALAHAAGAVVESLAPRTLVLAGGDTAHAVLHHLGCGLLKVIGEVEPGVPAVETACGGRTMRVITKAGGFGTEDLFVRIAEGG